MSLPGPDAALATALFALLAGDRRDPHLGEDVLRFAVNVVWIGAALHGLTAAPGAKWYAGRLADMGACAEKTGKSE